MDIRFKALTVAAMVSFIALNACNDNEYSELSAGTAEDQEIRFSVPEVQSGRAIETTSSLNSNGKQVMVYGVMHEGEWNGSNMKEIDKGALLDNVILTHNGTRWDYSPKAYWPQGENQKVTFFSYYPVINDGYTGLSKQIEFIEDNNTFAITLERTENKVIDQDVLYAVAPNMTRNTNGGNVDLSYRHALAKLNFSIKLSGDIQSESNFTISSVTLKNYRGVANVIYNVSDGLSISDMSLEEINTSDLVLSNQNLYFSSGQKMDLEAQLMLPQSLTEDACYGETPTLTINYSAVINGQSVSRELSYDLVNSFEAWESGKAYSYVLSVDLTSINVTCTVNDFVDGGVSEGIIPEVVIPEVVIPAPAEIVVVDEVIDMIEIPYDASGYNGGEFSFPIEVIYDAFGLDEESFNAAIDLGKVEFYGESADGSLHTSNTNGYGCWFGENQTCESWGSDARVFLEGTTMNSFTVAQYPGQVEVGVTYPTSHLIIYNEGRERKAIRIYLEVKVVVPPFEMPEEVPLPEYEIVMTYEITYEGTNPGAYTTPNPQFTLEDIMPDIQTLIGGEPNMLLMGYYDENLELAFQEWSKTDGWFGADQAVYWGSESVMFCLKPNADGTFSYCAAINDGPVNCKCTYRYANTATNKAVDVNVTVALTE